jgi:hypothetical protein
MKWVYLPTMFILAFAYTKFSFNDFLVPKISNNAWMVRKPASIDPPKAKRYHTKIPLSVFYKKIKSEKLAMFDQVSTYKGIIATNPYTENFGFVIDDTKKTKLGLIDSSEASKGVLFHDVLAHLVSAKILSQNISWFDYFEAYKQGLKNEAHTNSFYIEKGLESALYDSENFLEANMTNETPFLFTNLKTNCHSVDATEKKQIETALKGIQPKIEFFDLCLSNDKKLTYQALVRVRPQEKIRWISLKEVKNGDYDRVFNSEALLPAAKRLELIKANIYGHQLNESLSGVNVEKNYYAIESAEQFSSHIDFEQIPADDYKDIILDEAYALGVIHRNSLGEQRNDYMKAWATIPASMIDEKISDLKNKMKDFTIEE